METTYVDDKKNGTEAVYDEVSQQINEKCKTCRKIKPKTYTYINDVQVKNN